MKLSRDTWLAIGLIGVLVLVTVVAAVQQTQQQRFPVLAADSTAPDGAKALRMWMAALGYETNSALQSVFAVPRRVSLALILEPTQVIDDAEWDVIDEWVEAGGTLIVAGESVVFDLAARHYDFSVELLDAPVDTVSPQLPLFNSPPLTTPAHARVRTYLKTTRGDYITWMAIEQGPVAVSFSRGEGLVYLVTAPYLFTNAGLKEEGNPVAILNLISASPDTRAWFDEWHHGRRATEMQLTGPTDWLLFAPAGQALLFVAVVIFLALVLRGQRFGRPVPLPKDNARRTPLEYITALANLNRRAGHRSDVLRQYHQSLKRSLGHRYRLNASLPDAEYAQRLAAYDPTVDEKALLELLTRLTRRSVSENEMIRLAGEVANWTKGS